MHLSTALSGQFRGVGRIVRVGFLAVGVLVLAVAPAGAADPLAPSTEDVLESVEALLPGASATQTGSGTPLVGTFRLDPGDCDGPSGTFFRMVQPGGSADGGPFVDNNDSPCDDSSVTVLEPGTDGGLITGEYQAHPDPAFSGNDGVADRITQPTPFFGTDFAVATSPTDPQTGTDVPAPEIRNDGGTLSGDLRAFGAAWQTQHFNQGAPKPDGSAEGGTSPVTGTYDAATGRFTIEWTSQIQGGAFNNFTGVWHLQGTFEPSGGSPDPAPTAPAPSPSAPGPAPAAPPAAPAAPAPTPGPSAPAAFGSPSTGNLATTGGSGLPVAAMAVAAAGVGLVLLRRRLDR